MGCGLCSHRPCIAVRFLEDCVGCWWLHACACASAPPLCVCERAARAHRRCVGFPGLRQLSGVAAGLLSTNSKSDSNPGENQNEGFRGGYEQAIQPNNVHAHSLRSECGVHTECVRCVVVYRPGVVTPLMRAKRFKVLEIWVVLNELFSCGS